MQGSFKQHSLLWPCRCWIFNKAKEFLHGLPYLVAMKVRARLMKLPRLASSSELFLAVRSDHLKSVSEVSGLLLSRKYRHTCSSHGALSVHFGKGLHSIIA